MHQIRMGAIADIAAIQNDGYRRRQEANDRSHSRYMDSILEIARYSQGGYQYELPDGYQNVYGDGQGGFILSNDSNFDPNVDLDSSSTWSLVEPDQ